MVGFTSTSPGNPLAKIDQETLPEFLYERAKYFEQQGLGAYLVDGITGDKRCYKDFESQTMRIASCFYKRGLRKGDVVIYMTSYQLHQFVMMTGVWRANGIVRSLYIDDSEDTILEKLEECNSRWLFCDAENAAKCQSIAEKAKWPVEVIICGPGIDGFENFDEFYKDDGKSCPKYELKGEDIALILPTSGTTGPSKGAMHKHKTVIYQLRQWARAPFTFDKPNIIASKGTHISGIVFPMSIFAKGVQGIVLSKVNKEILLQTVDKYKPGLVFAFPSYLLAMGTVDAEGYDVTSVEFILTGGSPISSDMHKTFMSVPNVQTVVIMFGMTEAPSITITADFRVDWPRTYSDFPDSSVGRPFPGTEIQIRDLETFEVLDPNQRGEVYIKGDFLFGGYYKNPESTKASLKDGWFQTGDVGYLDENGCLYIVDRAKDIFKYFHNHISPTELERVIGMHPEVQEACIFPIPDEGGEIPRAFVTLKDPNGKNLAKLATEIKTFADEKLATFKQLKGGLYIVNEFPKGKTGKVVRTMVAQLELPNY